MRKRICVLILGLCMLLLCACGAVDEAEEAIAAIGQVTPESGEQIGQVQMMLDELSDRQLKRVDNLQEFRDKKDSFERICDLLNEADRAIGAIGAVTPDSGQEIEAARNAVDALQAENLTGYVDDEKYRMLEEAEEEYKVMIRLLNDARDAVNKIGTTVTLDSKSDIQAAWDAVYAVGDRNLQDYISDEIEKLKKLDESFKELEASHLYETAIACFNGGDYELGNEYLVNLKTNYRGYAKTGQIEAEAVKIMVALAEKATGNKEYKKADDILKYCHLNYFQSATTSGAYEAARDNLDKKLASLRPATKKMFHNSIGGGYGQLQITAGSTYDALIRLESTKDSNVYMLFYVRKGETATVSVKDGEYYVKYYVGSTWYGEVDMFGNNSTPSQFRDTAKFTTTYSENYVNYTKVTASLTF